MMDISPESSKDSDCINSSLENIVRYNNTVMENLQTTNQEPDDILRNLSMTHDEKDNHDLVVTDSTNKIEFHMQTTSAPFTSLDQDLGLKTSKKAHGVYKDNVKPVEEGSNLEPDGDPNTSIQNVNSGFNYSSHSNKDHSDPELTVAFFGSSEAVQFGCDNFLLGEKQVCLKNAELQRKISDHRISVINWIGSHENDLKPLNRDIDRLLNEIHAFIFVMRLGQLADEDKMRIEWLQKSFGDRVLSCVIILFTYEREEESETIIDDLKNNRETSTMFHLQEMKMHH